MSDILHKEGTQTFLPLLQGVINRFAANSSNCKTWCVTLVSAIVLFSADKKTPEGLAVAYIPTAFFLFLDAYYLSMERDAIDIYKAFVKAPSENKLFKIPMPDGRFRRAGMTLCALTSFSVFPCYLIIAAALCYCAGLVH